jgi:hypothetical protein
MPADANTASEDIISRALDLIDASSLEDLVSWLHQTSIRDPDDPSRLRRYLAEAQADGQYLYPAMKAAEQLLTAAGHPA